MMGDATPNPFSADIPLGPSLAEAKAAILANATATKQQNLDPVSTRLSTLLGESNADEQRITGIANGQQGEFSGYIGSMVSGLTKEKAAYDPNSAINKGKLFTAAELSFGGPLTHGADAILAGVDRLARLGRDTLTKPASVYAEQYAGKADPLAQEAYKKLSQNQELSPTEQAILDTKPPTEKIYDMAQGQYVQQYNSQTNRELLDAAKKYRDLSSSIPETLNKIGDTASMGVLRSNPERNPGIPGYDIPKGISAVGNMLLDSPIQTLGAIGNTLSAATSDDPYAHRDSLTNQVTDAAEALSKKRDAELTPNERERKFIPLPDWMSKDGAMTIGDINDASSSTGFSNASMLASLAGAAGGKLLGPVAGKLVDNPLVKKLLSKALEVGGGMAASGTAAYLGDKNMATRQLLEAVEKGIGRPLTTEERTNLLEQTASERSAHGKWEAIPEAIGNALEIPMLGKILKNASPNVLKTISKNSLVELAKEQATELGTETVTQIGQNQAEHDMGYGMGDGERMSFSSPADWKQALQEVGPTTLALSAVHGGGAHALGKLANSDLGLGEIKAREKADAIEALGLTPGTPILTGVKAAGETLVNAVGDKLNKSDSQKQRDTLHQADAAHGYQDTLKAAVDSGDISKHIDDPTSPDYNPHLAIDALAEINKSPDLSYDEKATNLEQAMKISDGFATDANNLITLKDELKAGTLNPKIRKKIRELENSAKGDQDYHTKLISLLASMNQTDKTPQELKTALDEARTQDNPEEVTNSLRKIFGSSSGGTDIASMRDSLQGIQNRTDLTPETQSFVNHTLNFADSAKALTDNVQRNSSEETTNDVHEDVLNGPRGVGSFTQSVSAALARGDEPAATRVLNRLSDLADAHQQKAETLRRATEAVADPKNKALTPEEQQRLDLLNQERVAKGMTPTARQPFIPRPGNPGWESILKNVAHEADTLAKAVPMVQGLFSQYGKIAPDTSSKASDAPVIQKAEQVTPSTPVAAKVEQRKGMREIHADFMSTDRSEHTPEQLNATLNTKDKILADESKKFLHPYAQIEKAHIESLIEAKKNESSSAPVEVSDSKKAESETQTDLTLTNEAQTKITPEINLEKEPDLKQDQSSDLSQKELKTSADVASDTQVTDREGNVVDAKESLKTLEDNIDKYMAMLAEEGCL